jgi:hypothetical protein
MAAKLTRLTHKIAIQLHLVADSCTICSSRSRWPVQELFGYILECCEHCPTSCKSLSVADQNFTLVSKETNGLVLLTQRNFINAPCASEFCSGSFRVGPLSCPNVLVNLFISSRRVPQQHYDCILSDPFKFNVLNHLLLLDAE